MAGSVTTLSPLGKDGKLDQVLGRAIRHSATNKTTSPSQLLDNDLSLMLLLLKKLLLLEGKLLLVLMLLLMEQ